MQTINLQFKRYTGNLSNISIVNNNRDIRGVLLDSMLWMLGGLAICYLFFLGTSVFNIIERKAIENDSRVLSNEVGQMELQYIALSSQVNLAMAESMGFHEAKIKYATAKNLGSIKIAKNEL